jgi:Cupin domain
MAQGGVRRVVTGTSPEGKSVVVSDGTVAPITAAMMPGCQFFYFWGDDAPPTFPSDGTEPPYSNWFPPPGGFRFELIVIPPDATPKATGLDMTRATTEAREKLPGLLEAMDPNTPGMHRTDSIDFIYVVSGQCLMRLDDGVTVSLAAGDTVVQNGIRHGWNVPYAEPCRLLCISIGGSFMAEVGG